MLTTPGALIFVLLAGMFPAAAQESPRAGAVNVSLADAVRSTLAAHPFLAIQKEQVEISRALRRQASAAFNMRLSSSVQQAHSTMPLTRVEALAARASGFNVEHESVDVTQFQAGADKFLRSGIELIPTYTLVRSLDNLATTYGRNFSHAGIAVVLPLLRGRGYAAVGGQEIASEIEIKAAQLDLGHTASQLIANTAVSYWNYLAAKKTLAIAIGSEERGRSLVDNVQAFIDADKSPRSDLHEVTANLADRVATRVNAEQRMIAARAQLAYDMGLAGTDIDRLGEPLTEFPAAAVQESFQAGEAGVTQYTAAALRRRGDFLAALRRIEESEALVTSARSRIKPQINLTFSIGYSGLKEGTGFGRWWEASAAGGKGLDAAGGIAYNFSPANDAATGQLAQAEAQRRQATLRAADIQRQIRSGLVTAAEGVRHQANRVASAARAVRSFEDALSGEREKYRLSMGSVIDILTMEDRLTNALINEVQASQAYALALVDFRFGTGAILNPVLSPADVTQTVDEQILLTLPDPGFNQEQRRQSK